MSDAAFFVRAARESGMAMHTQQQQKQPTQKSVPGGPHIPDRAGVSFKADHREEILDTNPEVGWFEVHPENYMVAGGPRHAMLSAIRERYPLSLHGVALSLAGAEPLDGDHLRALRTLIDRYEPGLVSEHLAWSAHGRHYFADLLPVPLSQEALDHVCRNVDQTQEVLGRQILIENPSNYLMLEGSDIPEPEFLQEVAKRTGCRLLFDVNNVYVSSRNVGYDAEAYVDSVGADLIGEIHLAGHAVDRQGRETLLIDDHGAVVCDPVWNLYERLIGRVGPKPTLVEWDTNIPDWPTLYGEACKADRILGIPTPHAALADA